MSQRNTSRGSLDRARAARQATRARPPCAARGGSCAAGRRARGRARGPGAGCGAWPGAAPGAPAGAPWPPGRRAVQASSKGLRRSSASGLEPGSSPSARRRGSRRPAGACRDPSAARRPRGPRARRPGARGAHRRTCRLAAPEDARTGGRRRERRAARILSATRSARRTSSRSRRSTSASASAASSSSRSPTATPCARRARPRRARRSGEVLHGAASPAPAPRARRPPSPSTRLEVVPVLEQAAQRLRHDLRLERVLAQAHQRPRPVERLGHARRLHQLPRRAAPQEAAHLARQRARSPPARAADDAHLLLQVGCSM